MKRSIILLRKFYVYAFSIIMLFNLTSCSSKPATISKSGFYFDTIITITLYDSKFEKYIDECFQIANNYEKLFSNTIESSDISKINSNPGEYIEVSEDTILLLEKGISYSKYYDGVFDITVGKLTDLWNISNIAKSCEDENNKVDSNVLPNDDEINIIKQSIDYNKISINDGKVMLIDDDCKIDVGAIAKGYIADQMKKYLIESGVDSGIINLGGNVLTLGNKNDGSNYTVGIQKPFAKTGEAFISLEITDKSVVTSGIYERYFWCEDKLYHHILDTKTGYPCENDLYSVTIISDNSVDGDAFSTLCFLLGSDEGLKFVESIDGIDAIFIKNDMSIIATSNIKNDYKIIE